MLEWPPGNPEPGAPYIHGFIDCLYQDGNCQWRIVDFKTNRTDEQSLIADAAYYQMQLFVYALAVEQILGEPPDGTVLCFLRPGLEYHFEWNEKARRRAIEMVDRAISS